MKAQLEGIEAFSGYGTARGLAKAIEKWARANDLSMSEIRVAYNSNYVIDAPDPPGVTGHRHEVHDALVMWSRNTA